MSPRAWSCELWRAVPPFDPGGAPSQTKVQAQSMQILAMTKNTSKHLQQRQLQIDALSLQVSKLQVCAWLERRRVA